MSRIKDLTGKKIGKLTALKMSGRTKTGQVIWLCICECGKEKEIRSAFLSNGSTISCGCARKGGNFVHKLSGNPLYQVYHDMKCRCYNKNHRHFRSYGGRGIKVCSVWVKNFISFYEWAVKNGYKKGLQIDRRDNNGNYKPANCRWVTAKVNLNNTRATVYIKRGEETRTVSEWAEILGIKKPTLYQRFKRHGSVESIFTNELNHKPRRKFTQ